VGVDVFPEVALMDTCDAACPDGATFADVHEAEFEGFAEKARARAEAAAELERWASLVEDGGGGRVVYWFGVG
jgi:hypothetical protein